MKTELRFKNGVTYSNSFKEIQFNSPSLSLPDFSIPPDTIVSDWDLNSKSYSETEIKNEVTIKYHLPQTLPRGLKLTKIIRQKGPIPAFTALYENPPYALSVMFFKNFGMSLIPQGRGLKIPVGPIKGELIPNPHVSTYSFIQDDVQYILIGNIQMDQILDTVQSMAPSTKL
jgi:hypothetical protein